MTNQGRPTREELTMVRDYCILPIMLDYMETQQTKLGWESYSLKELYLACGNAIMDRIHADLVELRKEFKARNIKVVETGRVDTAIHYKVYCRGYEEDFAIMKPVVKAELGVRLGKYAEDLMRDWRK